MLMVNMKELLARQIQMENGELNAQREELEPLLYLLWTIREMDLNRDYSMAGSIRRVKRDSDAVELALVMEPKVLTLLEKWAEEIRAFLESPGEPDGRD